MPKFPITEAESEALISAQKQIISDVSWSQKSSKSWSTAKLPVEATKGSLQGQLELIITVNTELPSKFSMTLVLNGAHIIRRLDIGGSHSNSSSDRKRWHQQTHKHTWSDQHAISHAYTPQGITGSNLCDVFTQFCKECNIVFKGQFHDAAAQPQLPGV